MEILKKLNSLSTLYELDKEFISYLTELDKDLTNQLIKFRTDKNIDSVIYADFILKLAPFLDDFIENLFNIEQENNSLKIKQVNYDPIYECKRKFITRDVVKKYPTNILVNYNFQKITQKLENLIGKITELNLAKNILTWLKDKEQHQEQIEIAALYCSFMIKFNSTLNLFNIPKKYDEENKVRDERINQLSQEQYLGFDYRDREKSLTKAYDQAKYCIYCHPRKKDSCSKGLNQEKQGCPLEQKISEMNLLKAQGFHIGALATAIIDNPIIAATGHRICNDCMKSCIYQKQDAVNIPLIESNILDEVLNLPWGVEIYLLLTKWNPLNISNPLPKKDSNYNIMVVGSGPAGFSLAHYLLNDGHNVTMIDGLKIDKLDFNINEPIKNWQNLKEKLSGKIPKGFGGVMEYGITNRWDKNNLTIIRLILERRKNFNLYGGVRLGSNITLTQVFRDGFDHVALCIGAGKPKFLTKQEFFVKGVRSAADFLMCLQQGATYIENSNANLLTRFPAVIIGCGLTAIDSAVELLHYYPKQVENFAKKCTTKFYNSLNEEDKNIADEFLEHAKILRNLATDKQKLDFLNNQLGGVTVCYRKNIKDSPAYKLNHEEIEHALALGIKFKENYTPEKTLTDQYGYLSDVCFQNQQNIKAKTLLISIGTESNNFEDINRIKYSDKISYFGDCNEQYAGNVVKALASAKDNYRNITKLLNESSLVDNNENGRNFSFKNNIKNKITAINRLSENIIELIIHAPYAVENFKPGQFFKLQNYNNDFAEVMKPLALTGAYVEKEKNLISLIILEMGKSSNLCKALKIGEEISLMGPTGIPTYIAKNKKIVLVGGGLGNAVLLAVGQALKENNCEIIYFAGYKHLVDRFYYDKIEAVANRVIWCCDEGNLTKNRAEDFSINGNILQAIKYAKNKKLLENIDQIICIGSDKMMNIVAKNKNSLFGPIPMICSINSPMQCMMKGICGQCVQIVKDQRKYIFTCACQDQDSDIVDFKNLNDRLTQNSLLEKIRISN